MWTKPLKQKKGSANPPFFFKPSFFISTFISELDVIKLKWYSINQLYKKNPHGVYPISQNQNVQIRVLWCWTSSKAHRVKEMEACEKHCSTNTVTTWERVHRGYATSRTAYISAQSTIRHMGKMADSLAQTITVRCNLKKNFKKSPLRGHFFTYLKNWYVLLVKNTRTMVQPQNEIAIRFIINVVTFVLTVLIVTFCNYIIILFKSFLWLLV